VGERVVRVQKGKRNKMFAPRGVRLVVVGGWHGWDGGLLRGGWELSMNGLMFGTIHPSQGQGRHVCCFVAAGPCAVNLDQPNRSVACTGVCSRSSAWPAVVWYHIFRRDNGCRQAMVALWVISGDDIQPPLFLVPQFHTSPWENQR
jgi:hypothetical protein